MLILLLPACTNIVKDTGTDDDSGGYVYEDTSPVEDTDTDTGADTDTGPPVDTAETGDDTGDTGPVDTGAPTLAALDAFPASMVVHPGATWAIRVVATELDGARDDAAGATFTSDDEAVATVDAAGVVTAVAAGATTVRVALGGLEDTLAVEVVADGVATVTVTDAATGLPVEGVRVALQGQSSVPTDASGIALVPVADGGPIVLSAWGQDDTYNTVTLAGTVSRRFTLPLWPKDVDPDDGSVTGTVDYTGVDDADWNEMVVGFAAATIQGELGALVLDALFAEDRALTVYGIEVNAPANLIMEGVADDYAAPAQAGPVGLWGLAGPLLIEEASSGLAGTGDALRLLVEHLGDMTWGQTMGGTAARDAQTSLDLGPVEAFDATLALTLPTLPAGFAGNEDFFVLVTEERADEGYVGTGLGIGDGAVDVATVPAGTVADSLGTAVLAYAQVGGVGSGGASSSVVGRAGADGAIQFPPMLDVVTIDAWDPATRALVLTADPDVQLVRVRLVDTRRRVVDLYVDGSWTGEVPVTNHDFGTARATLEVQALRTTDGVYEEWVSQGVLEPDALPVQAAARATQ